MKAQTETDIVRACLEYLKLRGVLAFRNNSGGCKLPGHGGRGQFVRFGHVGSSDILGVLPLLRDDDGNERRGVFLAIEAKTKGGKLTEAQRQFLGAVNRAGGLAFVVHSLADLIAALAAEGVP